MGVQPIAKNAQTFFLLLTMGCLALQGRGQDANYWNSGYSAGGYVLPGAVIANNGDSGVLFYNPALLVKSRILRLSANATIYHINSIDIKNGAGEGYDLHSTSTGSVPVMVAGNVKIPFKRPLVIAYGIIQPEGFFYTATQRRDDQANVLDDSYSPGKEIFVGQLLDQNSVRETYLVSSAGWNVSKNLSVGVSLQGLYRTQTVNVSYYARAMVNPGAGSTMQLVSTDVSYFVDYGYIGMLGKVGLAWEDGVNHAGLLVTVPNFRLTGKGTLLSDYSAVNMVYDTAKPPISFLANTRQQNLPVTWKTPFSVALGYTRDFERWQLYLTLEYFAAIKNYNVITPRAEFFFRGDSGLTRELTPELLRLQDERTAVLNWSVGAGYNLNSLWKLYGTFRSNYSYANVARLKNESNLSDFWQNTSYWDLYNIQVGVNLRRPTYNIRAGGYANFGGTGIYPQTVNFSNASDLNFLQGNVTNTSARYAAFGIIISYVHNF